MNLIKQNQFNTKGLLVEYDAGYINNDLSHKGKSNNDILREFNSGKVLDQQLPDTIELYAVLQKYGVENKNGRIYPEDILRREAKKYQEFINMKTSLGESNHPESSIIDLDRVSHIITEIWWEGRTLMGKLTLDTTPGYHKMGIISSVGDKIANMLRKGWTIGISSRGVGSLRNEGGKNIVDSDFEIICWDIVTSPSTPGAWISTQSDDLKTYTENIQHKPVINEEEIKLLNTLKRFL